VENNGVKNNNRSLTSEIPAKNLKELSCKSLLNPLAKTIEQYVPRDLVQPGLHAWPFRPHEVLFIVSRFYLIFIISFFKHSMQIS